MKRILIAILAGLLLIGAGSAVVGPNTNNDKNKGGHHDDPAPVIGVAMSNAEAFAKATSVIEYDLVATSTKDLPLKVYSGALTTTWQIDDAKVDPVAASNSVGSAWSGIIGDINVQGKDNDKEEKRGHHDGNDEQVCSECTANVAVWAGSDASAYNAARGSLFAGGESETKNIANTWANDKSLGSESIAKSESEGFAMGESDDKANIWDIGDLVPKEPAKSPA